MVRPVLTQPPAGPRLLTPSQPSPPLLHTDWAPACQLAAQLHINHQPANTQIHTGHKPASPIPMLCCEKLRRISNHSQENTLGSQLVSKASPGCFLDCLHLVLLPYFYFKTVPSVAMDIVHPSGEHCIARG